MVQKGGIPRVPGCIKHTGVVTQLIRKAQEGRGEMVVLWLHLFNAYWSRPHKLVETSHVPGKIRDLILYYYSCFSLRVTSGTVTPASQQLEKGIITECSNSVILFAAAMNMLVKSVEVECRGPSLPIRAYQAAVVFSKGLSGSSAGHIWTSSGLGTWLVAVEKSGLPGKFKY